MQTKTLAVYFILLIVLCAGFVAGAKLMGQQGAYLAQGYMLSPAIAALLTRLFFYPLHFKDANLRFGKVTDYVRFWLASLGIMALTFALYTILGAVSWDFTGNVFLGRLAEQFALAGQSIDEGLPPGMTPKMMLIIFFIGGLTIFNIPGVITGFGEEFGHRGLMFPLLYQIKPWVAFVIGGLIWFAWHLPLMLIIPQTVEYPAWLTAVNFVVTAIGSVCTFIYLAYVYVKSRSVFVTAIAHIAMNNASMSLSYFVILQNQVLANVGTVLAMVIVVAFLYYKNQFAVFREYFEQEQMPRVIQRPGQTVPA